MNTRRLMAVVVLFALLAAAVRRHCDWKYLASDDGNYRSLTVRCYRVQFWAKVSYGTFANTVAVSARLDDNDAAP